MYWLIIAKGKKCETKEFLEGGSYSELCDLTTQYHDASDIKQLFKTKIEKFEKKYGKGQIVITNSNYPGSRYSVLYNNDKILFEKLLELPKYDEPGYKEMVYFWQHMNLPGRHISRKLPISIFDSKEEVEKNKKSNKTLTNNDKIINNRAGMFNSYLKLLNNYYQTNWNIDEFGFVEKTFPSFVSMLYKNREVFYQVARIVIKAFKAYKSTKRIEGYDINNLFSKYKTTDEELYNKPLSNITVEDIEAIEQVHEEPHSSIYRELYYHILKGRVDYIQNYLKQNPTYWMDFTKDEAEKVKSLIRTEN